MSERVLVLHSAPVKRVEHALGEIRQRGLFNEPEFTIFSRRDRAAEARFRAHPAVVQVLVRGAGGNPLPDLVRLRRARFDAVVVFFTGERGYWKMKAMAPWLGAPRVLVYAGDGDIFELSGTAYLRFLRMRRRKRRPDDFVAFQDGPAEAAPERILVVQSAPPELVAEGVRRLHAQRIFREPEVTLLIRTTAAAHPAWETLAPAPRICTHNGSRQALAHWRALRAERYDALALFLSGDPSFRKIKAFAFLCGARRLLIFNENLDCFFFSAGAFLRFIGRRLRHGVERTALVPAEARSERVLVLQSAEPEVIGPALERMHERRTFRHPHITLFARHGERYRAYFADHPRVQRLLTHARMSNVLAHIRALRRERYDAVVLFMTGDPSYWKMKYFAFLCGAQQLLIFNEHLDCFFFTPRAFLRFLYHRWRQSRRAPGSEPYSGVRPALLKLVRPLVFPLRFAYLLLYYLALQVRRPR